MSRNRPQKERDQDDLQAKEDEFILQQALNRASIRIKDKRAKPIDILALNLAISSRNTQDLILKIDGFESLAKDLVPTTEPFLIIQNLPASQLKELAQDISLYSSLEREKNNLDFWESMQVIIANQLSPPEITISSAVMASINKMLDGKTLKQLVALESQVEQKLEKGGAIDVEYWQTLLSCLKVFKAKANVREMYKWMLEQRVKEGASLKGNTVVSILASMKQVQVAPGVYMEELTKVNPIRDYDPSMSPIAVRELASAEKKLEIVEEEEDFQEMLRLRQKIVKEKKERKRKRFTDDPPIARFAIDQEFEAMKKRVAQELEAGDEAIQDTNVYEEIKDKTRPRKPRSFNHVNAGFDWNQYNRAHYNDDNPPPKVVQGYKFNIFYPDLVDKSKAPTYKIERDPQGPETVLIRFMAGPPYEDIAFRIVNKEWEYGHKRGFICTFEDGVLKLHFKFKKVYYKRAQ